MPKRDYQHVSERTVVALVVVSLAVARAVIVLLVGLADADRLVAADSLSYLVPAQSFAEQLRFYEDPETLEPMFVRTPGYPAFLATLMWIVGQSPLSLAVTQTFVLSIATLMLTFTLTQTLFGRQAGWIALACMAVEPVSLSLAGKLLTETLHGVLLLALALALVKAVQAETIRPVLWLPVGLVVALATLVRPTTYYLPPVLFVILILVAYWARDRTNLRSVAIATAALALPVLVLVGGWQLRNLIEVGSARFSAIESINMYSYRAGGVIALREGVPFNEVRSRLQQGYPRREPGMSIGEYYDIMYAEGVTIVAADPAAVMRQMVTGVAYLMLGEGGAAWSFFGITPPAWVPWFQRILLVAFWGLALLGLISVQRPRELVLGRWVIAVLIAYVVVISAGPEAHSRFRVPIMPLAMALAAGGLLFAAKRLVWRWRADGV